MMILRVENAALGLFIFQCCYSFLLRSYISTMFFFIFISVIIYSHAILVESYDPFTVPSNLSSPKGESPSEQCHPISECEMCTSSDQKTIDACKETGRKQKFECSPISFDESKHSVSTEIRACKRTEADEEFAMVRFQMVCLLVGSMAFASMRKQKRLSSSLFDQRRRGIQTNPRRQRDSNMIREDAVTIELSQESVPLFETSSNPLEVV